MHLCLQPIHSNLTRTFAESFHGIRGRLRWDQRRERPCLSSPSGFRGEGDARRGRPRHDRCDFIFSGDHRDHGPDPQYRRPRQPSHLFECPRVGADREEYRRRPGGRQCNKERRRRELFRGPGIQRFLLPVLCRAIYPDFGKQPVAHVQHQRSRQPSGRIAWPGSF